MGMFLSFRINKTGRTLSVYDVLDKRTLGEIYNREAYILYGGEGDQVSISFLSPSGFIGATISSDDPLAKQGSPCTEYPYGTANIDGNQYYTFIMRKTEDVYLPDERHWGTVAAGQLVATTNSTVGASHPNWKEINYVQRTDGQWIKVDGDGYNYGFVNTGITTASGYSKIPFYGSW